jgi:predicted phage-related endonuclease
VLSKNLILSPTANLSEQEWQTLRSSFAKKGFIGGSDAGTLLGLDAYRSPVNIFYDALGLSLKERKMNIYLLMGKIMETQIAELWQYWNEDEQVYVDNVVAGNKIRHYETYKFIVQNPDYPYLFANLDGLITLHPLYKKKTGILEIKTIRQSESDKYALGFPPKYVVQAQLYMLVTGLKYAEIAYLIDGRTLKVATFVADPITQKMIIDASKEHFDRIEKAKSAIEDYCAKDPDVLSLPTEQLTETLIKVAQDFQPPIDSAKQLTEFLSDRHKLRMDELTINGDKKLFEHAKRYKAINKQISELMNEREIAGNTVKNHMLKYGAAVMTFPETESYVAWRKMFTVNIKS